MSMPIHYKNSARPPLFGKNATVRVGNAIMNKKTLRHHTAEISGNNIKKRHTVPSKAGHKIMIQDLDSKSHEGRKQMN